MSGAGRLALRSAAAVAACLVAWAAGAAAAPGFAALSGKVTRRGVAVAGARVFAYAGFDAFLAHRPAAVSAATGADGVYRLELPPGAYHLVAKLRDGEGDGPVADGGLISYHGSNPFVLEEGSATETSFSLTRAVAPIARPGGDPGSGSLGGVVTLDGRPVAGAVVKLFLDPSSGFRGAGYAASPPTDERGEFRFEYLPESAYFVVARRRAAGSGAGPLAEGDAYGYFAGSPVAVAAGTDVSVELEMLTKGRDAGTAFSRPQPGGTRVRGRITDPAGAVVPGVHAFAYLEKVMSHKKPAALSAEVDAAGRYELGLPGGGTWFVGARSGYGDSPAKGEWYGRWEGTADHSVRLADGETLEGIDLVVERILP